MSSGKRLMHEIFTKRKPTATAKTSANKSLRRSSAAAAKAETDAHFQNAVNRFKKSCEKQRFRNDKAAYGVAVSRLASAKKFAAIENILDHQKRYPDIRHEGFAARLISLYGKSGMFDHARKMFDEMPKLNCPRGITSFNALLKSGIDSMNFSAVVELFRDLPRKVSVDPDLISYNIAIHAYCKVNDLDSALSTLTELEKSEKLRPDLVTFNTILDGLYKSGRFSEGETMLAAMETNISVAPDVRSYNAKLRGIMFRRSVESTGEDVVAEMKRKGIEPDLFSYNALINGYCSGGDLERGLRWYRELLQSQYCSPDILTFEVLVPACCKGGDFDLAFELCLEAINLRLCLKAWVFGQVVNGLVFTDKTDEALELVNLVNSAKYLGYKLKSVRV